LSSAAMAERVEELEAETKNLRELLANAEIKHKEVMPHALALSSVLGHTPADVTFAARVQSLEKVKETSKTFLKKAIDKKNALEVAVCCISIPFRVASFHLRAPCRHVRKHLDCLVLAVCFPDHRPPFSLLPLHVMACRLKTRSWKID
jgi:hypothetical protein